MSGPYPSALEQELDLADELRARGFIFNLDRRDRNGEYATRQWVKVKDIPGCGLLNSVFIRRPEDNTFPMTGAVQHGPKNAYYPLADIRPAKWYEFFFQPKAFGQIAWWQMGVIAVACAAFWAIGSWYVTPVITTLVVGMTFCNFKRWIV